MSISNYSELKTAIATFLDRDDLTADIDTFIDLAEADHKLDIRIPEMLTREALTVDARQVAFPSGYLETKTLRLLTNPVTVLKSVNLHEMNRNRTETSGKPLIFTTEGGEFEFDKAPDSSYSGEIIYYKEETALSDSNTSNNILTRVPNAYLYGALVHTAPYLQDDPRLAVWGTLYRNIVDRLNKQARRSGRVSSSVSRVSGPTP